MKISLALKTLLRTPLKTLMTFLLIAATSYMLFFSVAEYAVTSREFERAASYYKGTGAVEVQKLQLGIPSRNSGYHAGMKTAGTDVFLYTDPRVEPNYYGDEISRYTYEGFTKAEVDAISELPNVSRTSTRYMTAGVSKDLNRLVDFTSYYAYNTRFIAEVTFESIYEDPYMTGILRSRIVQSDYGANWIEWSDFKLIAGDPKWLSWYMPGTSTDLRMGALDFINNAPNNSRIALNRIVGNDNREYTTFHYGRSFYDEVYDHDYLYSLVPGERYLIIGRLEPQERYSQVQMDAPVYRITLSDSTTIGRWPQVYPLGGLPENYLELDEFAPLRELIEITNSDLHTLDVVYTDDMSGILRYAEGNMTPMEGRMLTDEDSENKNNVCVMSRWFMYKNGLKVGDTISLQLGDKLFEQNAALGTVAIVDGRYADNFTEEIEFEIVGCYVDMDSIKQKADNPYWNYSDNTIFVPSSFLPVEVPDDHIVKPGEFSIIVDARNISAFVEETRPLIEQELGLRLFFNDGGWLAIEKQINQADDLALVRVVLFSLSVLIAISLTVYLFIMRKRKEYAIMRALGTPRGIANRSLFIPLGAVAALALIAGNLLAYGFAGGAVSNSLAAYSQLGIEADASVPATVIAVSVVCELAALTVVTAFGLFRVGRKSPLELLQAGTNRNVPGYAASMSGAELIQSRSIPAGGQAASLMPLQAEAGDKKHGAIRHVFWYTSRHIRRTPVKVLLSVGLALLLLGTIGQFTVIRGIYHDIYDNMEIKTFFIDGLRAASAETIDSSGYVTAPYIENVISILECNALPVTVVMTNDITRYNERNNSAAAEIEFLKGYEYESLSVISAKENNVCVLDAAIMDALGVGLGDTVRFNKAGLWQELNSMAEVAEALDFQDDRLKAMYERYSVLYKVVGRSSAAEGGGSVVFIPVGDGLKPVYTQAVTFNDSPADVSNQVLIIDHAEFTLTSPRNADEYGELAKRMVTASIGYIDAADFAFVMDTSEAENMQRTIAMLDNLYPIAVAVAAIMGGLFPGLIVMQSDREASIMRVLGTTKRRTRFMLTLEQAVLCIAGLACAVFLLLAINGWLPEAVTGTIGAYSALHFAACVAGAAICAVIITQRRILELLQVKE